MKAVADEKLDGVRMDFEVIEAFLPEDFQLLGNWQLGNLDLSIERERLEDDPVCKAPTNSGRKVRESLPSTVERMEAERA